MILVPAFSSNPYINIAIEHYLLENLICGNERYVFLYINEPSVIIGRNQSIYREVNFKYLKNDALKVCRRITGGGAVYHDTGNLCFSFMESAANYKTGNYIHFNQCIIDALKKAGYQVQADERNNLLLNEKKISGNAQFTNRKNIISHGTLLYNSNLQLLREALSENSFEVETRAVASVRSSVMNLCDHNPIFENATALLDYIVAQLPIEKEMNFDSYELIEIEKLSNEFAATDWVYARSPHTKLNFNATEVNIAKARVESVHVGGRLISALNGLPFNYPDLQAAYVNGNNEVSHLLYFFDHTE